MAEDTQQTQPQADPKAGEPAQPQKRAEPDYRALYESERANSRKWEERAKENRAKLGEAPKAEELAEAIKRADEAAAKAERLEAEAAYAKAVASVAEQTGLSEKLVRVLRGTTAEELAASAALLKANAPAPGNPYPQTRDKGEATPPAASREAIDKIEDRDERERQMLAHVELYRK